MITVLFGLFLVCFFGFLFCYLIQPGMNNFGKIFISYPLGMGIVTFLMFLLSLVGFKLTGVSITIVLITINLILFYILKYVRKIPIGSILMKLGFL